MSLRNIGIFAHVDAGKTTLSERILLHAGAIRHAGSVDAGTAHTDTLPVERRRGISVKAACVAFDWKGTRFNLIDTPGHADFSAEIERSLWPLDGAVLLLDAVEGVQPQTEMLFQALRQERLPLIFFVNKCDRDGADLPAVVTQLRRMLTPDAVLVSDTGALMEHLCAADDALMARYLNDETIPGSELLEHLHRRSRQGLSFPVYTGSALRDQGVEELLDAMVDCLPPPPPPLHDLCGIVFSCVNDRVMGRGLMVRLFGGVVENRQTVPVTVGKGLLDGATQVEERKATQIRDVAGNDLGRLEAGMVGVVYGLGALPIGHVFGDRTALPRAMSAGSLRAPLVRVQVLPEKPEELRALREACNALSAEDPLLQARYLRALDQLQLQVMGTVQLEIIAEILQERFGLKVTFGPPAVIYKETIRKAARGFIDYTMPKPCWAILEFWLEPGAPGSGVVFESKVPQKDILLRYQHQVEEAIPLALRQGRLGWEVTDLKITLVSGCHHLEHTHPLDFIVATPMGIQDGLANAGSVLLEPILEAKFRLPPECIGRVISDVNAMRGEVLESVDAGGERVTLTALLPVSTSLEYATTLAMMTGGRGMMTVRLHSYRECPLELGTAAPRRTVDPLDTAKYILVARNAIEGALFDEE